MSSTTENIFSGRSSSGEYGNNPLSPPSVDLEPPNMSSPRSERSRDSPRIPRSHLNSATSAGETEFPISPKPPIVIPKTEHSPIPSTSSGRDGSPVRKDSLPSGRKRTNSMTSTTGEKRTATKICRVCGDKAYSYNFNVITCESCKAFFRRNANKEKEIRCPFNDQCNIDIVSRRFCQRCRLQKCFKVGMKKEWIMTEQARLEKKQRVQENRERRLAEANAMAVSNKKKPVKEVKEQPLKTASEAQTPVASLCSPTAVQSPVQMFAPSVSIITDCSVPPVTLHTPSAIRETTGPGSVESLPSPMIATAGFRPPILPEPLPSSNVITSGSIVPQTNQFISSQQQQSFVNQVTQQVQLATQAQIQQAAQLEQLHQQAAAQQFVQQQAVQLAAVQQQHQLAAAAAVVAAANTIVPHTPPSMNPAVSAITSLNTQPQLPSLNLTTQSINSRIQAISDPGPSASATDADMVTIPKCVLLRLIGQNQGTSLGEALQPGQISPDVPQKCACTCLCGRYKQGKRIVDEVMTEILTYPVPSGERSEPKKDYTKLSSRRVVDVVPSGRSNVQWFSGNSAVGIGRDLMTQEETELRSPRGSLFRNGSLLEEEMEAVKVDPDCCLMTSADQDRLNELISANSVWSELEPNSVDEARHQQGCPSKLEMVNMADGAIRRMIKMTKRIEKFRKIEHHDQMQLLRNSCMPYMILRGAMSYDPAQNVWKGPSPSSNYNIRMDAMKDTQDNLFENTIRFYATFKEEWRTNESVMLLLGMIVIFNPEFPNIHNREVVEEERQQYKRVLKRLLFSLCNQDPKRTNVELKGILDKLSLLKFLSVRAQRMFDEVDAKAMEPLLLEMFQRAP